MRPDLARASRSLSRTAGTTARVSALLLALCTGALAAQDATTAVADTPAPYVKDPRYWPEPVMDSVPPVLPALERPHAVLIFSKTNGFRDDAQIHAGNAALAAMVDSKGWDGVVSENAAVFNPTDLARFDVVVLNSTSGNTFTDPQRQAFRQWLEQGGSLIALHGAGGDHHYDWTWYVDTVLGAQFIGHTSKPQQFQLGTVLVDMPEHPAMRPLPAHWQWEEEWYAFDRVPSGHGTRILARVDESSFQAPENQRMGSTHPIVWTRCIERGRVLYSALGHKAQTYSQPLHLRMIAGALDWAMDPASHSCP